jgi:ATP-dependent Lon protease
MEESARAALSWVRSHAEGLGIPSQKFADNDIHVHVPSGAVKKDGPSAGVALATALVSLFSEVPVRSDVAMTGELTLRGLVLPVGGIKGKVLAAHRAGIRTVILPERNRKDLADIPDEVQRELEVVFVTRIGEALEVALAGGEGVPLLTEPRPPVPPPVRPEARSRRNAAS